MNPSQRKIVQILIERGDELLKQPYEKLEFTGDQKADDLLNNLEKFPHAFVLACIMDRQIKAEKAWLIPYEVSKEIGGFEFAKLAKLTQSDIHGIFKRKNLHRFNNMMASSFFEAIKRIQNEYNSNAANIWNDRQGSATIVRRFMRFNGVK